MSLRYPYRLGQAPRPVVTLGGRSVRPRPILLVTVVGPNGTQTIRALLDTGADDTVFPDSLASQIGVDLTTAPVGAGAGVGAVISAVRYAPIALRISQSAEQREWTAWVGFTAAQLPFPVLGFAGFLQFFTATFHGDREEVELTVNRLYSGT